MGYDTSPLSPFRSARVPLLHAGASKPSKRMQRSRRRCPLLKKVRRPRSGAPRMRSRRYASDIRAACVVGLVGDAPRSQGWSCSDSRSSKWKPQRNPGRSTAEGGGDGGAAAALRLSTALPCADVDARCSDLASAPLSNHIASVVWPSTQLMSAARFAFDNAPCALQNATAEPGHQRKLRRRGRRMRSIMYR